MYAAPRTLHTDHLRALLAPITLPAATRFQNWSQTYACTPAAVFEPNNEYDCELILELARRQNISVRASGVGHSPSDIACASGYLIRTLKLDRVLEVNVDQSYVEIQAGVTLDALHVHLDRHGLAMSNMGSISDQTIAGVTTVATHGTGINFKTIPTYVISLVLLIADGSKIRCSRQERKDLFLATLCGFGATGLVLSVQLKVEPAFRLHETQRIIPFENMLSDMYCITNAEEHVRFWWFPSTERVVVGSFHRTYQAPQFRKISKTRDFIGMHAVQLCLLLGLFVPRLIKLASILALKLWFPPATSERIDFSHNVFNLDCKFKQYTTEWAIPYEQTVPCLRELHDWLLREERNPNGLRVHFPIEIRFSDEDDIYLSPSYGRKTCWIGIIQHKPYGFAVPYRKLFKIFEEIVAKHSGRPHWSKDHSLDPRVLSQLYPRFWEFLQVLKEYDPNGLFQNEYVRRHIFGENISTRHYKDRL